MAYVGGRRHQQQPRQRHGGELRLRLGIGHGPQARKDGSRWWVEKQCAERGLVARRDGEILEGREYGVEELRGRRGGRIVGGWRAAAVRAREEGDQREGAAQFLLEADAVVVRPAQVA